MSVGGGGGGNSGASQPFGVVASTSLQPWPPDFFCCVWKEVYFLRSVEVSTFKAFSFCHKKLHSSPFPTLFTAFDRKDARRRT